MGEFIWEKGRGSIDFMVYNIQALYTQENGKISDIWSDDQNYRSSLLHKTIIRNIIRTKIKSVVIVIKLYLINERKRTHLNGLENCQWRPTSLAW